MYTCIYEYIYAYLYTEYITVESVYNIYTYTYICAYVYMHI